MICSETKHGALGLSFFIFSGSKSEAVLVLYWCCTGNCSEDVSLLCSARHGSPSPGDAGRSSQHLLLLPWYLLGSEGPQ